MVQFNSNNKTLLFERFYIYFLFIIFLEKNISYSKNEFFFANNSQRYLSATKEEKKNEKKTVSLQNFC